MRAEVRAAIDACAGPALVYDVAAIAAHVEDVAAIGRRRGVRVLFAMKSFAHDAVRAIAARGLDGLDAGSAEEARAAARLGARVVSITDPAAGAIEIGAAGAAETWVTCEDEARAATGAAAGASLA